MNTETEYIELVARMRDTVYRLARSIIVDDAEAEDITQDVFERVWRLRDVILRSDYPRAYVCRIAHNMAIDRYREQLRKRGFDNVEQSDGISDGNITTNDNDMAALTLRLIAKLPEKQRVAIHLRDIEGYEMEEIARVMESDESSARMNLSRARRTIREQLIEMMNHGVK